MGMLIMQPLHLILSGFARLTGVSVALCDMDRVHGIWVPHVETTSLLYIYVSVAGPLVGFVLKIRYIGPYCLATSWDPGSFLLYRFYMSVTSVFAIADIWIFVY